MESSIPLRIFTVTGTEPAARTAADTTWANTTRRTGNAAPPPLRVILGVGQPKFRSTWSAPASSTTRRTAAPTTAGSTPKSWTLRTGSSSPNSSIAAVVASPSISARADTISLTYNAPP